MNSFSPQQVQQIQGIVKNELKKTYFSYPKLPPHKHDGVDNIKVPESSIVYPHPVNGTITMAEAQTYTLNLTNTGGSPKQVLFYGGALNSVSGIHAMIVGNAQIGANQQFQTLNSNSVSTGPVVESIIQGSASMVVTNGASVAAQIFNSQGHIIYAEHPASTPVVIANVKSASNSSVVVEVITLASGWQISGLWTIT